MKSFGLWYSLRDCKSVEKEAEESIESEEQIEQLDSDIVLGQTESQNQKVNEKESEKATEQKKDNDNKESEPVFVFMQIFGLWRNVLKMLKKESHT